MLTYIQLAITNISYVMRLVRTYRMTEKER